MSANLLLKIFTTAILMTFSYWGYAQNVSLQKARDLYFSIDSKPCNALTLNNLFDVSNASDPLLKAYHGASAAASPACISNPAKKISYFNKGKKLIGEAVMSRPDNYEIRFLRFATQSKTPGFLGYSDKIQEDKDFLITYAADGERIINNSAVFLTIIKFLIDSEEVNQSEKNQLKTILKQLK